MKKVLCAVGIASLIAAITYLVLTPASPEQKIKRDALKAIALIKSRPILTTLRATIRDSDFTDSAKPNVPARETSLDFVTADVIAQLERMLDDPDFGVVIDVAITLNVVDPNNPLPLEKLVVLLDTQSDSKIAIIHAIGRFGPRAKLAIPRLLALLKDQDESTLSFTVQTLGYIGPDSDIAVHDLIPLLNNKDDGVVVDVAQCLGRIGARANEAVPALIGRYPSCSTRVRIAIIQALGKIRTEREVIVRFFDGILADTKAKSSELTYTLYNLPQLIINEDPVLENVEKLLQHRDDDVLRAANWVLERTKAVQPKAALQ